MDLVDRNLIGSLVDVHGNVHYEDIKNLPSEVDIIHCRDCKHYCNVLYQGTQFEYGECDRVDEFYIEDKKPHDFCSLARLKDEY